MMSDVCTEKRRTEFGRAVTYRLILKVILE